MKMLFRLHTEKSVITFFFGSNRQNEHLLDNGKNSLFFFLRTHCMAHNLSNFGADRYLGDTIFNWGVGPANLKLSHRK